MTHVSLIAGLSAGVKHCERVRHGVVDAELVVVGASCCVLPVAAHRTAKLVKDGFVLVEIAEFRPEVLMSLEAPDRCTVHADIPQTNVHVVARQHEAPTRAKPHVTN